MACACKKNKTIVEEKKTIEDLLVIPTTSDDKETNIDKLVEESMVLVYDVNHPVRKTYTIPVGNPESQKSFKEKIKSFFKI